MAMQDKRAMAMLVLGGSKVVQGRAEREGRERKGKVEGAWGAGGG